MTGLLVVAETLVYVQASSVAISSGNTHIAHGASFFLLTHTLPLDKLLYCAVLCVFVPLCVNEPQVVAGLVLAVVLLVR